MEAFVQRAAIARALSDFSLGSSVTDLAKDVGTGAPSIEHSPFDPPAPKGVTLWERVVRCAEATIQEGMVGVDHSLCSRGKRIKHNGLGFDYRRLLSPTDPVGDVWVDPAVEFLAFFGLAFVPVRGNGKRRAVAGFGSDRNRPGPFSWPIWSQPLTAAGIDAQLGQFWSGGSGGTNGRNVLAHYQAIAYKARAQMDQTRGFASERFS